jgi:CelD/BcsL family acetyltransferase involved in cellulose biosynthesis
MLNPQSKIAMNQRTRIEVRDTLEVRCYDSLDALAALLPAWEELLSQVPTATIFNTWEWLAPWWRAFGQEQRLAVLAFYESPPRLVGLAPLSLCTRRVSPALHFQFLQLMGDGSGDSDNLDLLVRPGYEAECAQAFLDCLNKEVGRWDVCQFNTMPPDSPVRDSLVRHLRERGWTHTTNQLPCSTIVLPDNWEAYLHQLPKVERKTFVRKLRRLEERYEVRCRRCTQEDELPNYLEALFQLHQKRWQLRGQRGTFASPARRQFYSEVAHAFLERGWLEFWLLELNGKTVAAQFNFRYRDTVYALQDGFDPGYYVDSVGYLLRSYVLRHLIADGVRRFDFLAGRGYHKARWVTESVNYFDVHFSKPFSRGSVYLRLLQNTRKTKEWLRGHLPAPVWAGLHWLNVTLRGTRSRTQEQPED